MNDKIFLQTQQIELKNLLNLSQDHPVMYISLQQRLMEVERRLLKIKYDEVDSIIKDIETLLD